MVVACLICSGSKGGPVFDDVAGLRERRAWLLAGLRGSRNGGDGYILAAGVFGAGGAP